jgi:hypothetical protein
VKASRCAPERRTLRFTRPFILAMAFAMAVVTGTGPADALAACEEPGTLSRTDIGRLDQLAAPSGAGRRPMAAFADGDLLFAVFEKMSAIVVPPTLSANYAGLLSDDQTTTVLLRRSRGPAFAPSTTPRIRDGNGIKVVPVGRSDEHVVVVREGKAYVILPGTPGVTVGVCADARTALLPARDAAVAVLASGSKIVDLGGERSIESEHTRILFTACCDLGAMRPDDLDIDPRQITDSARFARYLAAERFAAPELATDWTAAGRIAHEVLMQGRTQEAAQVLARLGGLAPAAAAPAVAMLADLASLGGRGDIPIFPPTPSSVRESRARIALARELLAACRDDAVETIAERRVDFAEVIPDLRTLPADIAANLVLCEARRLAVAGDIRGALTRLRAPDRPAAIEDMPLWLALDAFLLARAGQDELASFRRSKLRDLLLENGERADLRPLERFASPVELLGSAVALSYITGRGGSFGDRRIDVSALSAAIAGLPANELAARIDALAAWRGTLTEPALAARVDRAMARRILESDAVIAAGSPTHAYQLATRFTLTPYLGDLAQDLRLARVRFAVSAGLEDESRRALAEFLAAADPADADRVARFEEALDAYLAVRRALDESAIASDPVWDLATRDARLRVAVADRRAAILARIVGDAFAGKPAHDQTEMPEFRLLERLRALDGRR